MRITPIPPNGTDPMARGFASACKTTGRLALAVWLLLIARPALLPAQPERAPRVPAADAPVARDSRYALPLLGAYRKSMIIEDTIRKACETYGVPFPLARAVCMYESGGDEGLLSGVGARGYFQVMPGTQRMMKVATNIEAGIKYLSLLLSEFGREDDALAAYNGGPTRVRQTRPLPIETLQYVVGVGIYRTLLTREEPEIRAAAQSLSLYTTVEGDDWPRISVVTGVPSHELRLYNAHLALRTLLPGQTVVYPPSSDAGLLRESPVGSGPGSVYVTRRGDNYLFLAIAFGIDLERFRRENVLWRVQAPFEGLSLFVGPPTASGSFPGIVPLPAPEPAPLPPEPPRPTVHTVGRGETLSGIAARYGVSVEALRKANRIRRNRVRTGQVLRIPAD